jgi:hypothetical protein
VRRFAVGLALLAGCSTFENEDVVIDLRVLAMSATPPEQVVSIDPSMPPNPSALLAQLVPTDVCALIADPAFDRRVRYRYRVCMFGDGKRCDDDFITVLGSGLIEDPDTAPRAQTQLCTSVAPNGNLLAILSETIMGDPLASLAGAEYIVELAVGGEGTDPDTDTFASKTLRVAPKIPMSREANINPTLDRVEATIEKDGTPVPLALGRCSETSQRLEIEANARIRLTPIEAVTAREVYVVPTLDGRTMMFTESLTYQWLVTAGGFSSGSTGGVRDAFGNYPDLFTEYRAPTSSDLAGPTDVQLWIIQRDERYGATWYETCLRVIP